MFGLSIYATIYIFAWIAMTVVTFILYLIDKQKAKKHKQRIPEAVLLTTTFLLGAVGAMFGIYAVRHKTNHWYFKLVAWLSLIVNLLGFWGILMID